VWTTLALVGPLGFAGVGGLAFLLALAHVLYTSVFVALLVVGTAAAWILALRAGGLRTRATEWWRELRDDPWPSAGAAVAVLGIALARLTYSPVLNLADQTPLRYWADGLELAGAHRIPAASLQWGRLFPVSVSKVFLNAFNGGSSLVLGRGPLGPMGALLLVVSVALALAAVGLAREAGLRLTAPFVAVLLFANHLWGPRDLTNDLLNARAENWGRLLVLGATLLVVRALRVSSDRSAARTAWRGDAVAAGVLFGVSAGTHLVPTVVGAAFAVALTLSSLVVAKGGAAVVRATAVAGGLAVVVAALVLLAPRGDVGFQGASDTGSYRSLTAELGLPASFDPTRYLALGQLHQPTHPGAFYDPPSALMHEYVRRVVGEPRLRRAWVFVAPVLALGAVAVILIWGGADLRVLAIACVASAVLVLLVGLAFNAVYATYVLAEFGPRRLFDYPGLFAVFLGAATVETILRRVASRWPARRSWPAIAAAVAVAVLVAVAVPRALAPDRQRTTSADAVAALDWIARSVPCEGRILADRRTLATFQTFTGRAGVLEGMGPYLRPRLLGTALRELFDARAFFAQPQDGLDYLRRQGVAAVIATTYDQALGGVGGPLRVAPKGTPGLDGLPFLRLAKATRTVRIYRVVGFEPSWSEAFPRTAGLPGYGC
jgi:hypothetical protein